MFRVCFYEGIVGGVDVLQDVYYYYYYHYHYHYYYYY